jgi:hypothetical protein
LRAQRSVIQEFNRGAVFACARKIEQIYKKSVPFTRHQSSARVNKINPRRGDLGDVIDDWH